MPQANPAERVVDRRETGDDTVPALQLRLDLDQRDVRAVSTSRRRSLSCGPSSARRWPPKRAGAGLPVVRTRCISLIAADGLTANRRAASRIDPPRSTARTIRCRRSKDIGAGMTTSRLSQPILSNHRHRFHAIGICSRTAARWCQGHRAAGRGRRLGANGFLTLAA